MKVKELIQLLQAEKKSLNKYIYVDVEDNTAFCPVMSITIDEDNDIILNIYEPLNAEEE